MTVCTEPSCGSAELTGPPEQVGARDDQRAAAGDDDPAVPQGLEQPGDGLPGGADRAGQLLLAERDGDDDALGGAAAMGAG